MKKYIATILMLCLCFFSLCGCKGTDYKKANEALSEGNYQTAWELFTKLKRYKDSEQLAEECRLELDYQEASALYDNGQYEEAVPLLAGLNGYKQSNMMLYTIFATTITDSGVLAAILQGSNDLVAISNEANSYYPNYSNIQSYMADLGNCAATIKSGFDNYRKIFPKETVSGCNEKIQRADAAFEKSAMDAEEYYRCLSDFDTIENTSLEHKDLLNDADALMDAMTPINDEINQLGGY